MSELQEFVEHIQTWHEQQMGQLKIILDAPKDAAIKLGDVVELTGEKAEGFRMGVLIAQSFLGKLPFSVDTSEPDEEADDLADRNLGAVEGLQVIDTATGLPKKCAGCGTAAAQHNTDCKFEHFLSYSGLHSEPDDVKAKLRQAFEAAL